MNNSRQNVVKISVAGALHLYSVGGTTINDEGGMARGK